MVAIVTERNLTMFGNDVHRILHGGCVSDKVVYGGIKLLFAILKFRLRENTQEVFLCNGFMQNIFLLKSKSWYDRRGIAKLMTSCKADILRQHEIVVSAPLKYQYWAIMGIFMNKEESAYTDSSVQGNTTNILRNLRRWIYDGARAQYAETVTRKLILFSRAALIENMRDTLCQYEGFSWEVFAVFGAPQLTTGISSDIRTTPLHFLRNLLRWAILMYIVRAW